MKSAEAKYEPPTVPEASAPQAIAPDAEGAVLPERVPTAKLAKDAIRTSLKASTADGVFAAFFTNLTSGVLLINFLMDLGASPTQIGLLAAIPLVANLVQPLGAYISEQIASRHRYCLAIYAPSRLLWLLLLLGIGLLERGTLGAQTLIHWTLAIALVSAMVGALGSAAWLSWMAMLVPRQLRGRYFGLRNSAANLTNFGTVPLAGLAIAHWHGGSVAGFAVVLGVGIICGMTSLKCQDYMADVNPKLQRSLAEPETIVCPEAISPETDTPAASWSWRTDWSQYADVLMFLIYFSVWMFSMNLSAPFFNLYMLSNLNLNISQVTLYNSLMAGANLLMLTIWGRLADRIGNRSLLVGVGLIMALTPLLWLFVGTDQRSVWLWLPLLHLLMGGAMAAIDLCSNNLQIGVAPVHNQSSFFGWIAAAAGVSGAGGTVLGGYLAENWQLGGLLGLFIVSSLCRVAALFPLLLVREHRSVSLSQLVQVFAPFRKLVRDSH